VEPVSRKKLEQRLPGLRKSRQPKMTVYIEAKSRLPNAKDES
jgi:hypothetical protein